MRRTRGGLQISAINPCGVITMAIFFDL